MEIGERIFKLLGESKSQQKKLSEITGIPEQTISSWKKRKSDPPAKHIYAIADFLNVSVVYLLTGKDETRPELVQDEQTLLNDYRKLDLRGKSEIGHTLYKELERINQEGDKTKTQLFARNN